MEEAGTRRSHRAAAPLGLNVSPSLLSPAPSLARARDADDAIAAAARRLAVVTPALVGAGARGTVLLFARGRLVAAFAVAERRPSVVFAPLFGAITCRHIRQ